MMRDVGSRRLETFELLEDDAEDDFNRIHFIAFGGIVCEVLFLDVGDLSLCQSNASNCRVNLIIQ